MDAPYSSVERWVKAALAWDRAPQGHQQAVKVSGLDMGLVKGGWIKVPASDGTPAHSVRWSVPQDDSATDDLLDRATAAFSTIVASVAVLPPANVRAELCNVLPLYDVHWGMAAWSGETGGDDYDLDLARSDLIAGLERVLEIAPQADTCVILVGGDFFHANDNTAQTQKSKHVLDVAARMFRVIDTAIDALKYVTTRALENHESVVIRVLRGNHDEDSCKILAFALREWLRDNNRASIDMDQRDLFQFQWGRAAIYGHHGDKGKPEGFALKLADVSPFWSACKFRYAYTGHQHKLQAERIGGLYWERLDPFAPSDDYGSTWVNRRALKIDTYHKNRGRVGTYLDPIEREEAI
jgi:predicted phosphodiesterase